MRNSTLLFLVKKDDEKITGICLAMKKRGFGVGRYNGAGGKVGVGETIEEATCREAQEEIGVTARDVVKCAELLFIFPHKEDWNQLVHVYITNSWTGEIIETDEMKPVWFAIENIPYDTMWPDDIYWLPEVLNGKRVQGAFTFGEGDVILEKEVIITERI